MRDTVAASQWSTKQPPSPYRGITVVASAEASSSRATALAREKPRPAVEAETPSRRVRVDLAQGLPARAPSARAEAEDIAGARGCASWVERPTFRDGEKRRAFFCRVHVPRAVTKSPYENGVEK